MKKEHSIVLCSLAQGDLLKTRCARALGTAGLALMLGAMSVGIARAESAPVGVPDRSFPESVTSTKDGTLYVGSFNLGGVVKAAPGGKAEQFIKPGSGDSRSTLGVLADEKSGMLYVCSNDITGFGVPGPGDTKGAWLKVFDLASGALKGSAALKDPKSLCNDIAVGPDGTAYVTDSFTPNVYSLKPGGTALEVWATDPLLAPAKDGVGLDGIAFGSDGNLYVTTYIPAALFRIAVRDGKAGAVTALKSSRALDHADAMRTFGDSLLLIEGNGKLDKITIKGDDAEIETIKDGFTEPVSVTLVGDTAWVAEGKLSYIIGDNKGKDPGPFTLKPVALPK
ncbi:SMP-30/gluconolactonase/LRE family protein [Bradyrhizobium sp.]|uniref:SMP-30/gluconolactonase/LRE family protein n=1 Tax=Bradyrhizobium sp. TaxID=376 RepID=UPI003C55195A